MPRKTEPPMTFIEALQEYYGGVHGLSKMPLPFTCKCGGRTYSEFNEAKSKMEEIGVMHVEDCYKHIRRSHRERIKAPKKPEKGNHYLHKEEDAA